MLSQSTWLKNSNKPLKQVTIKISGYKHWFKSKMGWSCECHFAENLKQEVQTTIALCDVNRHTLMEGSND